MLQVENIHTYYGESYVLQGISLTVPAGSVTAVLGRNGVGKTTLLRSVIGLSPPRSGRILFGQSDVTRMPPYGRVGLGMALVPQGRRIFPSLTVLENLQVAERRGHGARWNADAVFELFPRLHERRTNRGNQLSGGEQQLLAVGRALVSNPTLLLMDEPTEGLAPLMVRQLHTVVDLLKQQGISILLVEQNLRFATQLADTVYILSRGVMVHQTTPAELAADQEMLHRYLAV